MQTPAKTRTPDTIPTVRRQVVRFVLDVFEGGHAINQKVYRTY